MHLRSVEIRNFRSLEHVKLDGLSQFNVLIGRNNSGKSAVFAAVQAVNDRLNGVDFAWQRVITDQDAARPLEVRLLFDTNFDERTQFANALAKSGPNPDSQQSVLLSGPFNRQLLFVFASAPESDPSTLNLHETHLVGEDAQWIVVQRINPTEIAVSNPVSQVVLLDQLAGKVRLIRDTSDIDLAIPKTNTRLDRGSFSNFMNGEASGWPQRMVSKWLRQTFFFTPFRHSTELLQVSETNQLSQSGSNLGQVLHTINSNDRTKFNEIERFVQSALPDIGGLQTPLTGAQTYVAFRSVRGGYLTRIHEMGGGIEQLLMAATVLVTTGDDWPIVLEEPESHLHPGAQRFLIEHLLGSGRQVFLTTHSPTFVNVTGERSLYQVGIASGRTSISLTVEADALGAVLEDIGLRNSDVLLSDAVVFVESDYDAEALTAWAEKLDKHLIDRNITPRPIGGGRSAHAKVGSRVLQGVSEKVSAIPHLYVLDRDERSESEIEQTVEALGQRVWFLAWRELENYFLIPTVLRRYLARTAGVNQAKLQATSDQSLQELVERAAERQRGRVLVKRVRAAMGGVTDDVIRQHIEELIPSAQSDELVALIERRAEAEYRNLFDHERLVKIVEEEGDRLDREWSPETRLALAPGEEVLKEAFGEFGFGYTKRQAPLLAKAMEADEIPDEIRRLVEHIFNLAARTRSA